MSIRQTATFTQIMQHSEEWLTVGPMAKKLGVHPDTIRRWARIGKLKTIRHPVNNYRLFLIQNLEGE